MTDRAGPSGGKATGFWKGVFLRSKNRGCDSQLGATQMHRRPFFLTWGHDLAHCVRSKKNSREPCRKTSSCHCWWGTG